LLFGLSNAQENAFFYLGLPVGAILFGLFLIAHVLEKESALYDEQNRATEILPARLPASASQSTNFQEVAHHPALTTANPH
jgi:ABC-type anion transport system duplicated permease subunit